MSVITRFIVFIGLCLAPSFVFAVGISPEASDISLENGQAIDFTISILNDDNYEKEFEIKISQVEIGAERTDISFLNDQVDGLLVKSFQDTQIVKADDFADVDLNVVATDAKPGVYTYAVLATEVSQKQGQIKVLPTLASLIFITVDENSLTSDLNLLSFASDKMIYVDGLINFYLVTQNNGETVISPSGTLKIDSMTGRTVDVLTLNEDEQRVLPGQARTFEVRWDNANSNFRFGWYRGTLELIDSQGEPYLVAETMFFVLPIKTIIVIFVIMIIVWLVVRKRRKL